MGRNREEIEKERDRDSVRDRVRQRVESGGRNKKQYLAKERLEKKLFCSVRLK